VSRYEGAVEDPKRDRETRRIVAARRAEAAHVGPGAPGLGIAGFVLSLLGISLRGLILSWIGLAQAKREGRPTGMCSAGIIISIAWMILSVGLVLYSRSAAGF